MDDYSQLTRGNNIFAKDPYLILRGPVYSPFTKIAPFVDAIKRKSEWKSLGFNLSTDKYGNYKVFIKNGLCYRFRNCLNDMLTDEQLKSLLAEEEC